MYSRIQNQFAVYLGIALAGAFGLFFAYQAVKVVGDLFSYGVSTATVSIFLSFAGPALMGLSIAFASLLYLLFPSNRSFRWLLITLCVGALMSICGWVGLFG